ncbi:MAG TPA: hypothetical protein VFV87_12370 [Pirellulaceae bacterium]|nr:hypothetical protein [Pirellulaceae bacterium]
MILGHFIPLLSDTEAQGAPSVGALLAEHLTTALTNLNACELVGLQEQLDDSVNLFCAATGMLPPRHVARVNITLHRTRQAEIDGRARELYETYLRPERELYAAAEGIFRRQLADLHRRLAAEVGRELDTSGVRDVLRRRYFERRSREIVEAGIPSEIAWSPADNFPGRNLHDRERHGGQSLRWTGPAPDTVFYFPLQPRRRVKMAIRLHPATPHTHADRARLQVNGAEISLLVERSADGYLLTGVIDPNQPPEECGVLSEFTLTTPVVRGAGEFRELGVALEQISIEPHRMVVPAPHRLGERSAAPLTASR